MKGGRRYTMGLGASLRLPQRATVAVGLLWTSLLIVVTMTTAAVATDAKKGTAGFRCQRPFSAMDSMTSVAKATREENCNMGFFRFTDAAVELQCNAGAEWRDKIMASSVDLDEVLACNVTLHATLQIAEDAAEQLREKVGSDKDYFATTPKRASIPGNDGSATHDDDDMTEFVRRSPFLSSDEDIWRYSLALRAKGDSTVTYKGFDNGNGYSLCCAAFREGECRWMLPQQGDNDMEVDADDASASFFNQRNSQVLSSCPLPFAQTSDDDDMGSYSSVALTVLDEAAANGKGGVAHIDITKPLHRFVQGSWELTLRVWRQRISFGSAESGSAEDGEMLGRIIVPFRVDAAALQREGRLYFIGRPLALKEVGEVQKDREENEDL